MDSFVQNRGRAALTAFAVAWLALGGLALAGQADKAAGTGYAGEKTCLTCHEAQTKGYHGGVHGRAFNPKTCLLYTSPSPRD